MLTVVMEDAAGNCQPWIGPENANVREGRSQGFAVETTSVTGRRDAHLFGIPRAARALSRRQPETPQRRNHGEESEEEGREA